MYDNFEFHEVKLYPNGVLHVQLNRPKLLNAMHHGAYTEYGKIFRTANEDGNVRVIVLSGVGRALCAGLDVMGMAPQFAARVDLEKSRAAIHQGNEIRDFQANIGTPHTINKPVIGVAHGPCIGLAIDILTAVDIRFAAEDAFFSVREIEIGMAADIGTLQRLPKIVGNLGWVKDVALTGRNFDAKEALQQGFVQRSFPTRDAAVEAALAYAGDIALKSPVAVYGTKKSINYAIDHTVAEGLDQIAEFNSFGLGDDFIQGSMAFRSKKKPDYPKL